MEASPCVCFSHYTSGYLADLGFVWSCPPACLGRVGMAERAAVHSIQMIDAISAEIGGITPTTATASANEDVEAGEKLVQHPVPAKILKDNVSRAVTVSLPINVSYLMRWCEPRSALCSLSFADPGLDLAPGQGAAATVQDLEAAATTGWSFSVYYHS